MVSRSRPTSDSNRFPTTAPILRVRQRLSVAVELIQLAGPRMVPALMLSESRVEHDLQLCIQLVHALDTAYDIEKSNFLTRNSDEFLNSIEPVSY